MLKKRIISVSSLLIMLAIIISSCEDVVEVELNDETIDLISVEAYINTYPSNNVRVKVEKTLPVDQPQANPPVNGAIVQITDDQTPPNSIVLAEEGTSGIYSLPANNLYPAVPGRTYFLSVTTPDGVSITAKDYLQKVEKLDSIKVNLSARGDYEFMAIFINSQETPGVGHYYKWDIHINNNFLYESEYLAFANDELVDGNYIYDLEIFTDFVVDEEDEILQMGDTVYVEQLSISKAAYDFYLGMMNQAFSGSPFSVPPANIPNNLSSSDGKKVLGIFSARDISRGNSVVIDSTNYTPLKSSIAGL